MTYRIVVALSLLLGFATACDHVPTSATGVGVSQSSVAAPKNHVITVYSATVTASPSCADQLPDGARTRHYVATLLDTGQIHWEAPTIHQPPGHALVSTGHLDGNAFTMMIGTKEDPQSDNFHGIWEIVDATHVLTVSGSGTGAVQDGQITGVVSGEMDYYQEAPNLGFVTAKYCSAEDHAFVLAPQK